MKKIQKVFSALSTAIVAGSIALSVLVTFNVRSFAEVVTLTSSYSYIDNVIFNPNNNVTVELVGKYQEINVKWQDRTTIEKYKQLWLIIADVTTDEIVTDKFAANTGEEIILSTDLPDGNYKFKIFYQLPGLAYTDLFRVRDVVLANGVWFFKQVKSPVHDHNQKAYDANKTDIESLKTFLLPSTYIECDNPAIVKKALEVTKDCKTDYEKLKAIHDFVATHVTYDLNSGIQSAAEVFKRGTAVCEGYAGLTAAMLRAVGIPAKKTFGNTDEVWNEKTMEAPADHTWNLAYVDNRWVLVDVTWDSDSTDNVAWYSYFDMSIETLSIGHQTLSTDEIGHNYWTVIGDDGYNTFDKTAFDNYLAGKLPYRLDLKYCDISVKESMKYTGKKIVNPVKIKIGKKVLVRGRDFETVSSNNTKRGEAEVTITGIGDYSGTITKTFKIV